MLPVQTENGPDRKTEGGEADSEAQAGGLCHQTVIFGFSA
jgi:hypothetical protein